MAYLISKTAGGKRYFYLAQYSSKEKYTTCKYKLLYSFGNERIALERLSLWALDRTFIPEELKELGISFEDVKRFREKVVGLVKKVS
ncbi:hypothetical protein [Bacillus toyonensis]|uniref:Uncharacterized protein n=1 Tax=Bacillus toyonensis TaxID=155322 RepID=A0AB73R312_9BACI|nr:hypothetical protein [Bacillus toyonensis]MCU5727970.1 hypothetical protein [Bacillus toyonensis]PEI85886.1 hypothetical protein CN678_14335 [Bacillus toyonensis]